MSGKKNQRKKFHKDNQKFQENWIYAITILFYGLNLEARKVMLTENQVYGESSYYYKKTVEFREKFSS